MQVFLIFSTLMYLVATIHLIFAGFRFYESNFFNIVPNGTIEYLQNPHHWEFLGLIVLLCIQTWMGDALVIYRCYFIWDNNIWVIAVPSCLLLGTIGLNIYVLYWIRHPLIIAPAARIKLFRTVYPSAFVQSFLTTSLIALKIFLQELALKKAGTRDAGFKLSLIYVIRMVIESAGIYTIHILVLNILFFRDDNFQFVVQSAIIPIIGITVLLIAVRMEAARKNLKTPKKSDPRFRSSRIRHWPRDSNRGSGFARREDGSSLPDGDFTTSEQSEQRSAVEGQCGAESIDWDSTFSSGSATRPKATATSFFSSKNAGTHTPELDA
ncbi:hypothetical protein D9619_004238 [Psilocybe cf. subviscida]|uniref:Uncharacterized protein n=1 Tax=Psilocybe cf. subviscida TaxID=2480587 RepID=A0A8H5BP67_9AGAR|nr:hypothetical protein D9619_004238 [Psilocybe cf. subviscida]